MPKKQLKENISEPIYLLHGWSIAENNEQKWQELMTELKKMGKTAIFLPIPGLSAPLNEVWDLDNYLDWLAKILPASRVVLLGHSFGGQLAIAFAAKYPERINQLILVDSAGMRDHALWPTCKRTIFLLAAKIGKIFFQQEQLRGLLYKLAKERDYQQAPPLLRRTMSKILDEEITDRLSAITCPTLLIWGQLDRVTPLKMGRYFHQQIKNSQLKIIPQARHSPQFTHPQQVARLVSQFVD